MREYLGIEIATDHELPIQLLQSDICGISLDIIDTPIEDILTLSKGKAKEWMNVSK